MKAPKPPAEQRRSDRRAAWVIVACIFVHFIAVIATGDFEFSDITLVVVGLCWLSTEYQREWEATR